MIVSSSGRSVEDSYCVPIENILLEGRCRDFTALRAEKLPIETAVEIRAKKIRFIILAYLSAASSGSSAINTVTVRVNSTADLDLDSTGGLLTIAKSEFYGIRNLVTYLQKHDISAVFCSDSIIDDLVYLTAGAGVTVVGLSHSFFLFPLPFLFSPPFSPFYFHHSILPPIFSLLSSFSLFYKEPIILCPLRFYASSSYSTCPYLI